MAFTPRIMTTASRLSASTTRQQIPISLCRPVAATSGLTRNHGVNHRWIANQGWQKPNAPQTRHATVFTTSRDIRPVSNELPLRQEIRPFQGKKYFTTTLKRSSAIKQDDVKEATKNEPQAESQSTTETSPATPAAVPELLKRITPPVIHENIYTLPNLLTTTRIITAPIISYALLHSQPVLAFGLFAYSSITDLVDGYLARRFKSGTVLGSILDPFADKLLMTLTTITLYTIGTFPWWLALVILGRDAGLLLSALYFRWISLPPPRTMTRYWDFSLPSAEVRPTEISKINTLLQFLLVANALIVPVLPVGIVEAWNLWGVLEGWMGLVAGTTIWSGLSYVFTRDAIRFIGRDRDGERNENGDGQGTGEGKKEMENQKSKIG